MINTLSSLLDRRRQSPVPLVFLLAKEVVMQRGSDAMWVITENRLVVRVAQTAESLKTSEVYLVPTRLRGNETTSPVKSVAIHT